MNRIIWLIITIYGFDWIEGLFIKWPFYLLLPLFVLIAVGYVVKIRRF